MSTCRAVLRMSAVPPWRVRVSERERREEMGLTQRWGRRTTVTNEEVDGSSDIGDGLEDNASKRLDFGGIGLNYKTRQGGMTKE